MPDTFDLSIDELRLDKEWLEHPGRYFEAARRFADARRDATSAKNDLEVVKAEVSRAIWANPAQFDLAKATVDTVNAAINEQMEFKEAQAKYQELQHRADIYAAYVAALDHRRRALENLVDLHGMNYFSTPRAKPGSEAAVAEINSNARRREYARQAEDEE